MKAFKIFSMAAVAFMMVACSSEDTALDNSPVAGQKVHFTATIAAPNSDASTRTTYTEITSGTDAGKIKVAWKQGDKIALIHNGKKDEVTVQTLNADGSANISGDITVGTDGEAVTIVYPAASVNAPASGAEPVEDATYATKWNSQDGTLTFIQDNLDFCRATSTLKVSGTNATLSDNISMESTIAIFKFTTKNSDGTATIDVRPLTINIGSQNYVITPASATNVLYVALPAVSSQEVIFSAIGSDTETYVYSKEGVTFAAGNYYQSDLKMKSIAIPGKFTVNGSGKRVQFSMGNLQALCTSADDDGNTQESWTWRFATNQWDYIGDASANKTINGNGSVSAAGTVDLFGWVGASSTVLTTAPAMYGISNSVTENDYGGETLKSDWGNVTITNGGTYTWRTLTSDEWEYVFNTRSSSNVNGTSNGRYAKATVAGKAGVILFPDSYTHPSDVTSPNSVNVSSAAYTANSYDASAWRKMESAGCVFLPAAGCRYKATLFSVGESGFYWSSTPYDSTSAAKTVEIRSHSLDLTGNTYRCYGRSVRLVRDAE